MLQCGMPGTKARYANMRRKFADEYLVDMKPKEAAIRAGYAKKAASQQANKLLNNPEVQAMIQDNIKKQAIRTGITADDVLNDIREMADIAIGRKPLLVYSMDKEGNTYCEEVYKIDIAGAKGHLELLGKHFKLFTDKVVVEGHLTHEQALDLLK